MKNLILPIGLAALMLAACGKDEEPEQNMQNNSPAATQPGAPASTQPPPATTTPPPATTPEQQPATEPTESPQP